MPSNPDETMPSEQAELQEATAIPAQRLSVIGIGASAGGLAALRAFFTALPEHNGLAFVVIVHLSPEHESILASLLQPYTTMPVMQVTEPVEMQAEHVYVIPPAKKMVVSGNSLELVEFDEPAGARRTHLMQIDAFFRSLAENHGDGGAVILSGSGSDGAVGIQAIKEKGGLLLAQLPEEAEYDGMPRSAIATGLVDIVAPVAELATQLVAAKQMRDTLQLPADGEPLSEPMQQTLTQILAQLRVRTGHDFNGYKQATLLRRLSRRMQITQVTTLTAYLQRLRQDSAEAELLFRDLLINVTEFFRDHEAWAALETNIVPQLFAGKGRDDNVRVWTVGCATGEEAYSIAMLLLEAVSELVAPPTIQIFASDLGQAALDFAREGVYPSAIADDISASRLARFFTQENSHYRVRPELRETILFTQHNLLQDPPFSRLDLLICRNLLIYIQRDLQEKVFETFYYALRGDVKQRGFLFLGNAESAEGSTDLFDTLDKRHRLYQRRVREHTLPILPSLPLLPHAVRLPALETDAPRPLQLSPGAEHQRLLEVNAPPSLLVDRDYNVLHLSERVGRYLLPPGGTPTTELLKLVRQELQPELRTALARAFEENKAISTRPIPVRFNGAPHPVYLMVRPHQPGEGAPQALVFFWEDETPVTMEPDAVISGNLNDTARKQLEGELRHVQNRLQSMREEYETTVEELRAANEELQSTNEEYKSTLEELETSKEELQSINEELQTINQELKTKIDEVTHAHSDVQNLFIATDIATLFLDRELRVKRYTPAAAELFNLMPPDRGRPIAHLRSNLLYNELESDAQRVLATLVPIEREAQSQDGRYFLTRVRPYRTIEDKIDGVVITFVDITSNKANEDALRNAKEYAESIVHTIPDALLVLDPNLRVQMANDAFYEIFQVKRDDTEGRLVYELGNNQWQIPALRTLLEEILPENKVFIGYEVDHTFESIGRRTMLLNGRRLDHAQLILLAIADITERKLAEEAVGASEERMRLLLESARDYAIFTTDSARRVNSWNAGAEAMFGYKEAEIVGQPADLLFTPEDRERSAPEYEERKAREQGRSENERWHIRQDGSRFYGSGMVNPLRDDAGVLVGFVKIMRDLTAQKQAEEALRASEEKFRTLFETIDEGFAIIEVVPDERGRVTDLIYREANRAFERQTGMRDVIGKRASEFLPNLEQELLDWMTSVYQTGESVRAELFLADLDRWYNFHYSQVGGVGSPLIAAVFDNITERKQSEANQEFILKLSDALRPLSNPVAVQETAMRVLGEHLKANRTFYSEVLPDEDTIAIRPGFEDGVSSLVGQMKFSDFETDMMNDYRAGRMVVLNDIGADVQFTKKAKAEFNAIQTQAAVGVPLVKNEKVRAILSVHQSTPRRWTEAEKELIQETAERTWAAVERSKVEEALRTSEEKYRTLFESIDEGFCLVEIIRNENDQPVDMRYLELNKVFERQTGLKDAVGKTHSDLGLQTERHWFEKYGQVARTGVATRFESYHPPTQRWYNVFVSRADGGHSDIVALVFDDITERKRRETNLAFVAELSIDFAPFAQAEELMRQLCEKLADYLGLSRCDFSEVDEAADRITTLYDWRRDADAPSVLGEHAISTFLTPEARQLYAAGTLSVANDTHQDPKINAPPEVMDALRIRAVVDSPYLENGEWKFLISICRSESTQWRADEIDLIRELTERIYIRLQRARAEEALRESEERQAFLLRLSDVLRPLNDPLEMQKQAARMLGQTLGANRVGYAEDQGDGATVVVTRNYVHDVPSIEGRYHYADYGPVLLAEAQTGRIVITPDVANDPRLTDAEKASCAALQIGSTANIPLVKAGQLRAILFVHYKDAHTWRTTDLELMQETADRTWSAVERARAEEQLRQREAELARVQRIGGVGGLAIDVTGGLTGRRSPEYLRLHGLTAASVNETHEDWLQRVHPDDRAQADRILREALAGTGSRYENEYRIIRPSDGQVRWIAAVAAIERDRQGQPLHLVGAHIDITERKRAEEALRTSEGQLRSLIANLPGGAVFIFDPDLHYLLAEGEALRVAGLQSEELVGKTVSEALTSDLSASYEPQLRQALAGVPFLHEHDAHGRSYITRGTPLRATNGDIYAVLAVSYDISDRKRAEHALQELNDSLEQEVNTRTTQVRELASTLTLAEQRERRRLSQLLHDDLQQLLYGVQMRIVSIVQDIDGKVPASVLRHVEETDSWLTQAIQMVRQLTVDLSPPVLKGEGLTDALRWLVRQMLEVNGLHVELYAQHPFRLPSEDMRVLLFQIVRELLFNVVKHSGTDHAKVELLDGMPGILRIIISDKGRGFDSGSLSPKQDGGFGLFSIRERLDLFSGRMEIQSAPGQGTRITLTVPVGMSS